MKKLIINYTGREKRFALMKEQRAEKIYIEQPTDQSIVGNIYIGTVEKVLPGMNAVFVKLGEDKNGFLHRDKLPSYVRSKGEGQVPSLSSLIHQGERILVQVEKDATGSKGPRLTGLIELTGEHIVYMPHGDYVAVSQKISDPRKREDCKQAGLEMKNHEEGLIFRTSAGYVDKTVLQEELEGLRSKYLVLKEQAAKEKKPSLLFEKNLFLEQIYEEVLRLSSGEVIVDDSALKSELERFCQNQSLDVTVLFHQGKEGIFSAYRVEPEIDRALKRIVWLDNGAYLIFDEAEALTVIDVNTGKFSGKEQLSQTVLATNLLAAEEIVRQIRLRELAGMILIDFIDMKSEDDRMKVLAKVETALKKDERRTKVIGFTPLGILQMTRKKTKVSLSEAMTARCKVCNGTGKVLSSETVAFKLERELWENRSTVDEAVLVSASEDVIFVFSGEGKVHLNRLEKALGFKILFSVKQSNKPFYEILRFGTVKELSEKAADGY